MEAIATTEIEETAGSTLSGILLIGGTSIGAGMLALPVVTGMAGFLPGVVVNALCWLFMLVTGLLLLEATLWMKDGANFLSMAERFLGRAGKYVGGFSYLFLYYCLLVSYLAGGTPLLNEVFDTYLGFTFSGISGYLLFGGGFGVLVYLGARVVDRVNWILMISLILSYVLLLGLGSSDVQTPLLMRQEWGLTFFAAPILFSAYGYHNIIPTLTTYLRRDVTKLRIAIIVGTSLPFIVYSLWQWMIIGSLTEQQITFSEQQGVPVTQALQLVTGKKWLSMIGSYFGFFALVTSFLGVSLSMVDFFADGLNVEREGKNRFLLCLLVFLPPALFAAANPGIFIISLAVAGGFGEAVLNGLFPILMVWVGRYSLDLKSEYRFPGGRLLLTGLALVTFFIIFLEMQHLFGN